MEKRITPSLEIADQLDRLAQQELAEVKQFLKNVSSIECAVLLIEACRCVDHLHVVQLLSLNNAEKLTLPDFDIVVRGWNVLFALLMQPKGEFSGVPLRASMPELRQAIIGIMHCAGRYVLLSRTAEMIRYGMVSAASQGDEIELELSERTLSDHFHDQVDYGKFAEFNAKVFQRDLPIPTDIDTWQRLRDKMRQLTFPWNTSQGIMVGYTADPEIDAYFLAAVTQSTLQWRDDAGIHPRAELKGCSGEILIAVVHALMSFKTKHILFVDEAIKRHSDVNWYMNLTIWTTRSELIDSLSSATAASEQEVSAALDLITVRARDADYFFKEPAPSVPLIIELCDGYLLTPVSGIFRNPFNGIRMLRESTSAAIQNAFRVHREEWMTDGLYALFQGSRYQRVEGQTKLRRDGQVITDIDAAIFDNVTCDLVLFQLKWQDFTSSNLRSQLSKAKNFSERVQGWAKRTTSWIDQYGVQALCQVLRLRLNPGVEPRHVRFIAIGRTNARFRSYGYNIGNDVLALPWSQFVRLRYAIGIGQDFFELLTRVAVDEAAAAVELKPAPYVLERRGLRILFKNIWSFFEDREEDAQG